MGSRKQANRLESYLCRGGGMVDTADLKSVVPSRGVWVRIPPPAPIVASEFGLTNQPDTGPLRWIERLEQPIRPWWCWTRGGRDPNRTTRGDPGSFMLRLEATMGFEPMMGVLQSDSDGPRAATTSLFVSEKRGPLTAFVRLRFLSFA